jgi:hypothetical protein
MKLDSIAIKLALVEKDWDVAVRLLASLFQSDGLEDAIVAHGMRTSVMPCWDMEEVQIRWQFYIYYWKRGQTGSERYPVYYRTPMAIIYSKGI